MKGFNEWKEEQDRIHNDYDAENAWYAGQQSKQAEVGELRKRIDEALKFASDAHSDLNIGMLMIVDILKGDQS